MVKTTREIVEKHIRTFIQNNIDKEERLIVVAAACASVNNVVALGDIEINQDIKIKTETLSDDVTNLESSSWVETIESITKETIEDEDNTDEEVTEIIKEKTEVFNTVKNEISSIIDVKVFVGQDIDVSNSFIDPCNLQIYLTEEELKALRESNSVLNDIFGEERGCITPTPEQIQESIRREDEIIEQNLKKAEILKKLSEPHPDIPDELTGTGECDIVNGKRQFPTALDLIQNINVEVLVANITDVLLKVFEETVIDSGDDDDESGLKWWHILLIVLGVIGFAVGVAVYM